MSPVASLTKEVNSRLAKRPLVFNGRLANRGLTSLVKEATAANNGATTISVPCQVVEYLQLIWRSGTRRWNLRVHDLQMSCNVWFDVNMGHYDISPSKGCQADMPYYSMIMHNVWQLQ